MSDDRQRLEDIIETCSNLERHITDRDALASNPLVQAAAQRWLEVIGEAAARLSPAIRDQYRDVAWQAISRDIPHLRQQVEVLLTQF